MESAASNRLRAAVVRHKEEKERESATVKYLKNVLLAEVTAGQNSTLRVPIFSCVPYLLVLELAMYYLVL